MTTREQKEGERATLSSVLAALGIRLTSAPQEGEAPDFVFDYRGKGIGFEVTMYRSKERIGGGLLRRQVESEWAALEKASKEFRSKNPDIAQVNVGLMFSDPHSKEGASCPCSKIYLVSKSVCRLGLRLVINFSPSKTSATARSHTWAGGVMHSSDTGSKTEGSFALKRARPCRSNKV